MKIEPVRSFKPSIGLGELFLRSAELVTVRRKDQRPEDVFTLPAVDELKSLHGMPEVMADAAREEIVDKVCRAVGEQVHKAVYSAATDATIHDVPEVVIAGEESKGFSEGFSRKLKERLPIASPLEGRILGDLHLEMSKFVGSQPFIAPWGSLRLKPGVGLIITAPPRSSLSPAAAPEQDYRPRPWPGWFTSRRSFRESTTP
jgi:hypothetical protein